MNKNLKLTSILLCIFAALALACKPTVKPGPDLVSFQQKALYPEGVEFDAKGNRFLVSSLTEGTVGALDDKGQYKVFIQDAQLKSTLGIQIDAIRDRLLVCNSDPGTSKRTDPATQGKLAGLGIYRLSTGKLIKYVDLGALKPGAHFCNDIALLPNGDVYITDSFSPIIYKVDAKGTASIFLENERFKGKGFNLNGIVYSKKGFLLVTKYNEGILFKIPLKTPEKFSQVKIDGVYVGADGLEWTGDKDGSLIMIANATTNKIVKLKGKDDWTSAEVTGTSETGDVFATTGVLRAGKVHVLYGQLNKLFNPKTTVHAEKFEIHKLKL